LKSVIVVAGYTFKHVSSQVKQYTWDCIYVRALACIKRRGDL